MAYAAGFTAVTGATYTAAQYNTYTRDNLAALWLYTTAGDMVYATSASTLARLALGAAYSLMRVNPAGTAPEWGMKQAERVVARRSSNMLSTVLADTDIPFNAEVEDSNWHNPTTNPTRITPISSGRYVARGQMSITNGSGVQIDSVVLRINTSTGALLGIVNIFGLVNGATAYINIGGTKFFDLTAGQYFTMSTSRSNSDTGVTINANDTWLEVERVR